MAPTYEIDFPLYQTLTRLTFDWADSYDSKNFALLASILAPTVTVDYSEAFGQKPITMSKADILKLSSNENRLGGIVDCIHHIGGSKYDRTSDDQVTGYIQVRTEYKRYKTLDKTEVEATGQGLTLMTHWYKRINGEWKLAGTKPGARMNDFNFDKIFTEASKSKI